jgi:polyisoprenoid-binding protein YceI
VILRRRAGALAATVALACALTPGLAGTARAADHYTIDPAHSMPEFEFRHLGVTTQNGRFDRVRGSIVIDARARRGSVVYEIDVASLDMGGGAEAAGSPGLQLLQALRFPKITFNSTQLVFDGRGAVVAADGELTLLGITRPLRVTVRHFQCSAHPLTHRRLCAGDISAHLRRSDFGMTLPTNEISDEIEISVPVEAYRD